MYDTCSVKAQWREVFRCGNTENPEEIILILGSCRVVPYINYMAHANAVLGNPFKIYAIDPINYVIDSAGNMLDTRGLLKALETDEHFLSILRETTIFIHEGLSSYGILNTVKPEPGDTWEKPVWIYDFMAPRVDVNIPNFHDVFILFNDFIAIDPKYRDRELTLQDEQEGIVLLGDGHIDRFCGICERSSFPEFGPWFRASYLKTRLFHSFNHVASGFTIELFRRMNDKFLKLDLPDEYWGSPQVQADIYANVQTHVTDLDRKWRPFEWS